jgi:hypothetical protein
MTLRLDYSKKDYDILLADIKKFIQAMPDNKWTDFLDSDIGYSIIKTHAAIGDFNNFYLDRQAAEAYLSTAELRESAVATSKQLGYSPLKRSSSSCDIVITIASPYYENIIFPQGSAFEIEGNPFFTINEAIIPQGSTETIVTVKQGVPYTTVQRASGERWAKINLPKDVIDISVYVNDILWEEVDSFIYPSSSSSSSSSSPFYRFYEDTMSMVVMFGGGYSSDFPQFGEEIRIEGNNSVGSSGNGRVQNAATTLLSAIYNSANQNISNIFGGYTVSAPSGGADEESLLSIKRNAPEVFTTQYRAVTASDYQAFAYTVPGVKEAYAWGGEEVGRYGEVFVCVQGETEDVPQSLLDSVYNRIHPIMTIPMLLNVIPPIKTRVDVNCNAFVKTGFNVYGVQNLVVGAISQFFEDRIVGDILQMSDLSTAASSPDPIDYVNLEFTPRLSGQILSNQVSCSLIRFFDPESIKVYLNDGTLIWEWSPSARYTVIDNKLWIPLSSNVVGQESVVYPDQPVDVLVKSRFPDVYTIREQRLALGNLRVTMFRSNQPE